MRRLQDEFEIVRTTWVKFFLMLPVEMVVAFGSVLVNLARLAWFVVKSFGAILASAFVSFVASNVLNAAELRPKGQPDPERAA